MRDSGVGGDQWQQIWPAGSSASTPEMTRGRRWSARRTLWPKVWVGWVAAKDGLEDTDQALGLGGGGWGGLRVGKKRAATIGARP